MADYGTRKMAQRATSSKNERRLLISEKIGSFLKEGFSQNTKARYTYIELNGFKLIITTLMRLSLNSILLRQDAKIGVDGIYPTISFLLF